MARAREAFMLRRWASILAQVKASGGVEGGGELGEGAGGSAGERGTLSLFCRACILLVLP